MSSAGKDACRDLLLTLSLCCLSLSVAQAQSPATTPSASTPESTVNDRVGGQLPHQPDAGATSLTLLEQAVTKAAGQPVRLRTARHAYAKALSAAGRHEEAAAQYEAMIRESDQREPAVYYNLGNAYMRAGKNEQAAEAYGRAIEQRYGHYARAHNNLGIVLVRLGRWQEAAAAYQKAIVQEHGAFADAHYNLAMLYRQQGDSKRAVEELKITLRLNPQHQDARLLAEQLRFDPSAGRSGETVSLTGSKNNPSAGPEVAVKSETFRLLQQARKAGKQQDPTRAVTLYQAALREEGTTVPAIEWELAETHVRLDNAPEAEAAYRRIIAQAGDRYPMAYYYVGRVMMKQEKYGAAAVMLRQALSRVGDAPYIWLALSESLEHIDDFAGAIEALQKYRQARLRLARTTDDPQDSETQAWYLNKLAVLNEKKAGNQ